MNQVINIKTRKRYTVFGTKELPKNSECSFKQEYETYFLIYNNNVWKWVNSIDYIPYCH